MRVFVVYDRDGWEIHGIRKVFFSYVKACEYVLKTANDAYIAKHGEDKVCNACIVEVEVEE